MNAFVGIDLAFAKNKRLPVSLCVKDKGRLIPMPLADFDAPSPPRGHGNAASIHPSERKKFATDTRQYLLNLQTHFRVSIIRVAIDAPSAPRDERLSRRLAESALDKRGISCFTTPTASEFELKREQVRAHLHRGGSESSLPAANQLWMQVGFDLFTELRENWECLEVYPQATMKTLGVNDRHKSTPEGLSVQLQAIVEHTGWQVPKIQGVKASLSKIVQAPAHDGLDAYSSAWVASLNPDEREALGNAPHDVIWVPHLPKLRTIDRL